MDNNHRVILVTGASSGIGKVCAEYLAQQGYRVYGTSRRTDATLSSNSFQMCQMDVTDDSSVNQAIDRILDRESGIDVVVNNAGFAIIGSLEDTTVDEAKAQLETNFFGALRVCRAVLPVMRQQHSGYIVNISSIGGLIGLPFQSAYSASKFALEGTMESLRMEVRPFGIRVVLIEPGVFKTGITTQRQNADNSTRSSAYHGTFQKVLRIVESGERQASTPEPIAKLIDKIIQMNSPRLRYTVGTFSQRMAVPLKKILPSRLFELLISGSFQVN